MHKGNTWAASEPMSWPRPSSTSCWPTRSRISWQNPAWTPTPAPAASSTMVDLINYTLGNTALTNETLTLGTVGTAKLPKWSMALMREGLAV